MPQPFLIVRNIGKTVSLGDIIPFKEDQGGPQRITKITSIEFIKPDYRTFKVVGMCRPTEEVPE